MLSNKKVAMTTIVLALIISLSPLSSGVGPSGSQGALPNDPAQGSDIMTGAVFYSGPTPSPANVTYTEPNGTATTVYAIPGWVVLSVPPATSEDSVNTTVVANGGTLLSFIPNIGLYVASVAAQESDFIGRVSEASFVSYATPDLALIRASAVATIDAWPPDGVKAATLTAQLTDAMNGINSPVVTVVVDDFSSTSSHGFDVRDVINQANPNLPYIQLTDQPSSGVVSWSQTVDAIAAAIAAAQGAGKKIVINLSTYGGCENNGQCPSTSAQNAWLNVDSQLLDKLADMQPANTQWAQWIQNNVLINQAAGNDGVDISGVMTDLYSNNAYGNIFRDSFQICGALSADGSSVASYSNRGTGVMFSTPLAGFTPLVGSPEATSFIAPICTADAATLWSQYPSLTSAQVSGIFMDTSTSGPDQYGVIDFPAALARAQQIASGATWMGTYDFHQDFLACNGWYYPNGITTCFVTNTQTISVTGTFRLTVSSGQVVDWQESFQFAEQIAMNSPCSGGGSFSDTWSQTGGGGYTYYDALGSPEVNVTPRLNPYFGHTIYYSCPSITIGNYTINAFSSYEVFGGQFASYIGGEILSFKLYSGAITTHSGSCQNGCTSIPWPRMGNPGAVISANTSENFTITSGPSPPETSSLESPNGGTQICNTLTGQCSPAALSMQPLPLDGSVSISNGAGGAAELTYSDGNLVTVGPNTSFRPNQIGGILNYGKLYLNIVKGLSDFYNCLLLPSGQGAPNNAFCPEYEVEIEGMSGWGGGAVRGTQLAISADLNGTTSVLVLNGTVSWENLISGALVNMTSGQGLTVTPASLNMTGQQLQGSIYTFNPQTTDEWWLALNQTTTSTTSSASTSTSSSSTSATTSTSSAPGPSTTRSSSSSQSSQTTTVASPSTTASSTTGGGGIPEFPYQIPAVTCLTLLIITSYLIVRRHTVHH